MVLYLDVECKGSVCILCVEERGRGFSLKCAPFSVSQHFPFIQSLLCFSLSSPFSHLSLFCLSCATFFFVFCLVSNIHIHLTHLCLAGSHICQACIICFLSSLVFLISLLDSGCRISITATAFCIYFLPEHTVAGIRSRPRWVF